jgi:hypothetical protein
MAQVRRTMKSEVMKKAHTFFKDSTRFVKDHDYDRKKEIWSISLKKAWGWYKRLRLPNTVTFEMCDIHREKKSVAWIAKVSLNSQKGIIRDFVPSKIERIKNNKMKIFTINTDGYYDISDPESDSFIDRYYALVRDGDVTRVSKHFLLKNWKKAELQYNSAK